MDGCFVRTKDDCIATKSVEYDWGVNSVGHDVRDIMVKNSVLWNGGWGKAIEIGFESRTESFRDIVFRDIDIIHVQGGDGVLSIENGDRATISNVLYEDLRIERADGFLFYLKILHSRYTKDEVRGHIKNITFKDIQFAGDRFPPSIISGFDENHLVENVRFENVAIQGKRIRSLEDGRFTNSHSRGIEFR